MYGNFFVCALHSKFLYGKNTNIFCMVFLYGKNPNIFVWQFFVWCFSCVRSQLLLIYTPSGSPLLLDTTQLYHHHWIEQGRLPLVHAKKIYVTKK